MVLWANPKHPLANEKIITGEMLKGHPFIMVPQGSYHFKTISDHYKNISLNVVMHSNQIPTIRYMLEQNRAVTILYEQVFENDKNLCKRALSEALRAKIGVFWKKDVYVTSAMKTFIRFAKAIKQTPQYPRPLVKHPL